ncbi:transcription initiation factor IIF, beta subunit-domain-containing protein [Xylariomycetidae sp. FL0641]|nr:transcription initiation factor IIF, beta subunit-domain-containing protein [Xylariomycetidae sp. FL0641]
MASVKPEPGIKPDPEAAAGSPMAMSDDDIYEDAGDLEFANLDPDTNPAAGSVYLTHVPKYLYDAWAHLDDDAEIQIGTVRQWNEKGKPRIAVLLDHSHPEHQSIPKEYNLDVKDMSLTNTFLFTEQDLPGYKHKTQSANSNLPPHLRRQQNRPEEKSQPEAGVGRKGKYQPRYRKAIPKKTVLAARFRHELSCQPVWTAETKHIMKMMNDDAMKPKATTTIVSGRDPIKVIQAGAHVSDNQFSNLVKTAAPEQKKAKKQKEEKAARMSQSELRDRIFECYDRFNYWSLKAFKQTLHQPEAWLRENLEELAVLHKSGRFANHWELKPEYKRNNAQSVEGAPPSPTGADESDFDADDDNVEMEDVV